jgi:PncC family amidohydrolase
MQQVVGELLRVRGLKIAAAESCTGGLVMARLTDVPGSSDYVDRGVVVYSNESKTDLLGVPASQIAEHGAVSESVAQAMAVGMARVSGADFALGITGIAGPSGGTPEKPVGMVVISAVRARGGAVETRVRTFNFVGGRDMVRFQASQAALDMVRRWIAEEAPAAL